MKITLLILNQLIKSRVVRSKISISKSTRNLYEITLNSTAPNIPDYYIFKHRICFPTGDWWHPNERAFDGICVFINFLDLSKNSLADIPKCM